MIRCIFRHADGSQSAQYFSGYAALGHWLSKYPPDPTSTLEVTPADD